MKITDDGAGVRRSGAAEHSASPAEERGGDREGKPIDIQQFAQNAERDRLSLERMDEIRMRILQGAYDSVEVVDQVARRLLDSGDI